MRAHTAAIQDPGDLLGRLPDDVPLAWVRQGDGLIAWGEAHRIAVGTGPQRVRRALDELERWLTGVRITGDADQPGTGPVSFASLTFDNRVDGSCLIVPRVVVGRRHGTAWMTVTGEEDATLPPSQPLEDPGRIRYAGASVPETAWLEAVAAAASRIRNGGGLSKVVLARDLKVWSSQPLDPRILARRLAQRFDGCWTFLCAGLVGATPELLVRRTGERFQSLILAGSAARGREAADDERLGHALLASHKDRVEHAIAVESVIGRLAALCTEVVIDEEPWLLRLANVQHLATNVSGMLAKDASALEIAAVLHPTAAVCGTPTDTAMEVIRGAEGMDRGRYAGPVGWMDARGDGEFGIALRCAEIAGTRARLFSGAGIVGQSLPEAELEETRLKLRAMQSALEGTAP
ncbi:MAG: isochorismate synthase [Nitriliruptorales bacterium]|nr:isochorismate synthase [Nitriliruptorales bacterium]